MEENWNCGDDVSNEDRCDWVVETLKWGIGCELDPSPHYLHALGTWAHRVHTLSSYSIKVPSSSIEI